MTSPETVHIKVKRYLPEPQPRSFYQEYDVKSNQNMFVLDALRQVRDNVDGTLGFRWSCRMGVCGSCGATVNGVPKLTCSTPLSSLGSKVVIEPLHNFPVVKDLVVELSDFMEKLGRIQPWIMRKTDKPIEEGEYRQTPEERERYYQYSACINCMLCYASCPVYAGDKSFIGPAASALAYRYNQDSRDEGAKKRLEIITHGSGIFDCEFAGFCSTVCPKDVDPALAIQKLKLETTMSVFKPSKEEK